MTKIKIKDTVSGKTGYLLSSYYDGTDSYLICVLMEAFYSENTETDLFEVKTTDAKCIGMGA